MPVFIDYILKLSICLAVVYLFYQLFLRRLTFYTWNRWYLMGYTALSFIIPFIDVMPELQKKQLDQNVLVQMIPVFGFAPAEQMSFLESLSAWDWVMIVGGIGSFILLIRFCIKFYSLLLIKKNAELLSDANTKIYQLENETAPFSFGNAIFVNTDLHSGEELEEIIRHEFVHVKQKHTIDLLWSELLCILLWFNPFVWLLRYSIKQNLEFLADKQVLQNGLDKKEYQYLLLKVMGHKQFAFTNHFNFSSLKNRIAMMNTIKSAKVHLTRFAFLVPVIAILLLSFRNEIKNEKEAVIDKAETKPLSTNLLPLTEQKVAAKLRDTIPQNKKEIKIIPKDGSVLRLKNVKEGEEPLYVIDGIVQKKETNDELKNINPDGIESISVLKGGSATSLYGSEGKNGVIVITTKKNPGSVKKEELSSANNTTQSVQGKVTGLKIVAKKTTGIVSLGGNQRLNAESVTISDAANTVTFEGVYIVDGKEMSAKDVQNIKPSIIKTVNVYKGKSATKKYGKKGTNGIIEFKTKPEEKPKTSEAQKKETSWQVSPANATLNSAALNTIARKDESKAIAKNERTFTATVNFSYMTNPAAKKPDAPIIVFHADNNKLVAPTKKNVTTLETVGFKAKDVSIKKND